MNSPDELMAMINAEPAALLTLHASPSEQDILLARLNAIRKLGDLLPTMTHPAPLMCIIERVRKDPNPRVVEQCIHALGRTKAYSAVLMIVDVLLKSNITVYDHPKVPLSSDECLRVRTAAAKALGQIKDDRAIPALMSVLNDKDENYRLRLVVAESLGRLGDQAVVAPLMEIVTDDMEKSTYLKESAVKALGMLGDIRAFEELFDMLESKQGFRNKFMFLKEKMLEGIKNIGQSSPKVSKSLQLALKDDAPSIRIAAIEALAAIGDEAALPLVQNMLFDTNDDVSFAAIDALYSIGETDALKEALALENLPNQLRESILDTLQEMNGEDEEEGEDEEDLPDGL